MISWSCLWSALRKIASSSSSMRIVEGGEGREEAIDEAVDNPVQQQRWFHRSLALPVALPDLCKGRTVLAVNGDKEAVRVIAMHLDQPAVVGSGTVDDDEDEVVVAVDFRPLIELLQSLRARAGGT